MSASHPKADISAVDISVGLLLPHPLSAREEKDRADDADVDLESILTDLG